jgi:hypothetical protein
MFYVTKLRNLFGDANAALHSKQFHDAGLAFGKFIQLAFYWDFQVDSAVLSTLE